VSNPQTFLQAHLLPVAHQLFCKGFQHINAHEKKYLVLTYEVSENPTQSWAHSRRSCSVHRCARRTTGMCARVARDLYLHRCPHRYLRSRSHHLHHLHHLQHRLRILRQVCLRQTNRMLILYHLLFAGSAVGVNDACDHSRCTPRCWMHYVGLIQYKTCRPPSQLRMRIFSLDCV